MSTIGKSKTTMSNGQLPEQEELLIPKNILQKKTKNIKKNI